MRTPGPWLTTVSMAFAGALALASATASAQTGPPKPKVPPGRAAGGIAVAVIGAGVDYRRPEIAGRLARDGEGEMIGWDVIDDDPFPLEAAPVTPRRVPPHAGTALARLLLEECQACSLVPIRVPDANALSIGGALAFAARTPARIVLLLTGPRDGEPAALFESVARAAPHLVVLMPLHAAKSSIDDTPGNRLAGLVATAAADPEGRLIGAATLARATAPIVVPLSASLMPAAAVPDRDVAAGNLAAARLAALAARLAAVEPGLDGATMAARLRSFATPMPATQGQGDAGPAPAWIERIRRIHWLE